MVKRAGLARALALDPELLFLDEPTSGLDPIAAAAFDELIRSLQKRLGLTVFLITHDLDSLHAICDRVAVLADKKVIAVDTIPDYWLWIILGYKSILTGPAGVLRRRAMITRSRPDGDPIELYHGRRRDGGSARRRAPVHRLARRALEQGDQMLRHLFLGGGRWPQQGIQRHLLGRPGRSGLRISLLPSRPEFVWVRIEVDEQTPVFRAPPRRSMASDLPASAKSSSPARRGAARRSARSGPQGCPVVPSSTSGLGALLNSAPELIDRIQRLTERLTELLSDKNQNSISDILENIDRTTKVLADRAPEMADAIVKSVSRPTTPASLRAMSRH